MPLSKSVCFPTSLEGKNDMDGMEYVYVFTRFGNYLYLFLSNAF